MVDSSNEAHTHVETTQKNKEATINTVFDDNVTAKNDPNDFVTTAGGTLTPTALELQRNFTLRLTGSPAAAFTIDLDDASNARNLVRGFENVSGKTATFDTITGVGSSSTITLLDGESAIIHMQGQELRVLAWLKKTAHLDLPLSGLREIIGNEIPNAAATGGLLASDTTPTYERVSGATDKAIRVNWIGGNVDEVQFPPVPMPHDLDAGADLTIHLLAKMDAGGDTPTIEVEVFDAIGDTEMGGPTAALSSTLAELTVIIVAANISGHPLGFLNISLIPGTHATQAVELYAAWVEYIKVTA